MILAHFHNYLIVIGLTGCLTLNQIHLYGQEITERESDVKKKKHLPVISGSYQKGYILKTNKFVKGENQKGEPLNPIRSLSLKLGIQTDGSKLWHKAYNYPTCGAGIHIFDFYNASEIGTPVVIYGFLSSAFKRWDRFSLIYDLEGGLSMGWNPYDPSTNPWNKAIGSKFTGYYSTGLYLEYELGKRFIVNAGVWFNHFSNGSIIQPNWGFNTVSPKINVKYRLSKEMFDYPKKIPITIEKKNELVISLFSGVKNFMSDTIQRDNLVLYNRTNYHVIGISSVLNRQVSYGSKIGLGFTIDFDESNNPVSSTSPWNNNLQVSFYPSYELAISRFSIVLQPCIYIIRNETQFQTPSFYQRVGFKFHFVKNIYIGLNLRAYEFRAADFIEWTMGYRIN